MAVAWWWASGGNLLTTSQRSKSLKAQGVPHEVVDLSQSEPVLHRTSRTAPAEAEGARPIMGRYIIKRLAQLLPVLLLVSIIVFSLIHLDPGRCGGRDHGRGPRRSGGGSGHAQRPGPGQPMVVQYFYLAGQRCCKGDLGKSVITHKPVSQMILARFPATAFWPWPPVSWRSSSASRPASSRPTARTPLRTTWPWASVWAASPYPTSGWASC
jgi:hypothetical protein